MNMNNMNHRATASSSAQVDEENGDVENKSVQSSYGSVDDSSVSPDEDDSTAPHEVNIGAVANLCSATLGAGVLALPYALQQAGLIWGGLLLLVAAGSTLYSLELLVQACDFYSLFTYESIVQQALGKRARVVTEVSILLFCGGCAVAYLITVADILQALHLPRNWSMVSVWCVAMVPLSLLKTMTSLQGASGIGLMSIFLLIVVANLHYWQHSSGDASLQSLLWPANGMTSVITACPLVLFAFSCQVNVCAIYQELGDKPHMTRVLCVAVAVCACLYTAISVAAYLDFSNTIQPNVLQNYCSSFPIIKLAFGGMTVAVVMAFPLNIFPTRVTIEGFLNRRSAAPRGRMSFFGDVEMEDTSTSTGMVHEPLLPQSQLTEESPTFSWSRHFILTLSITGLALGLALVAPNISVVFGLLGGTTSSILGFILPGMVGVKMLSPYHKWKAWVLVVGGVLVGILTTAVTVYNTVVPATPIPIPDPCNATAATEFWI